MASRRVTPLPPGWRTTRHRILHRDQHQCTATLPDGTRCPTPATDVDHITPAHLGGTDHDTNLASLCDWHHQRKTAAEANAIPRPGRFQSTRRPPEPHPGLT